MAHDVQSLVLLCLEEKAIPGPCGLEDPWDVALSLPDSDPETVWLFITGVASKATTPRQFGRLATGPPAYFWSRHRNEYLPRLAAVAKDLPALVNLVIAEERRKARAVDVMMLVEALAANSSDYAGDFIFTVPNGLAHLVAPGAHPLTEQLLLPNEHQFSIRTMSEREPSDAELAEIVEGYIRAPSPPDDPEEDDWWEALDELVSTAPRAAWRATLAIIAREKDGVDLVLIGAGALEILVSDHGALLAREIATELETNGLLSARCHSATSIVFRSVCLSTWQPGVIACSHRLVTLEQMNGEANTVIMRIRFIQETIHLRFDFPFGDARAEIVVSSRCFRSASASCSTAAMLSNQAAHAVEP